MGFPRILSKNNKIYTKLGEFALSADGNLWIICQTCQEEHGTQDQFWKHIQDEHNFLHGLKQEHQTRHHPHHTHSTHTTSGNSLMDAAEAAAAALLPLPLYRRVNEETAAADEHDHNSQADGDDDDEPKDYTEMRSLDASSVEIDIKVEPPSISQPPLSSLSLPPPPSSSLGPSVADIVSISAPPALYHLPQGAGGGGGYSTIIHAPGLPMGSGLLPHDIAVAAAAAAAAGLPKDSNSTTASASSAVSSDDGERWYICDHDVCGLKFKYQSRLELHRSVHSKERRFACELCGASFKQSCNLSTHRKKKHFLKGSKGGLVHQSF